jgi:CBS domain-containing protein
MMNEPLRTIMTSEVVSLRSDNTLGDVREILLKKRIHHVPIVDDEVLVGLVTSWDIFKLGLEVEDYQKMKVSQVMTRRLATLEPDDHIGAAAEVLMEHLFHAIPIVDNKNRLQGIVTSYDLLRYQYRKEYPENLEKFIPENMM